MVPTVPLDGDGAHHGFLRLPHSRDDSAWGSVMIPVAVIGRDGPTALLIGGSHGDEYEGPIALQRLAATLDPAEMTGRAIVLPILNLPAFRAGRRTSPIDGGNLNRLFPGRPDGTVTEKIAHFVSVELLPRADLVLDIHSGGRTLDFLPFAAAHVLPDPGHQARCVAAMEAFAAPYSCLMREIDDAGMLDTEAERRGLTFVTTEIGGGGTATARTVAIAARGARNLLIHAGVLEGEPEPAPSRRLTMPDERCFHFAERDALVEPLVDLGEEVGEGRPLVRLWPADRTGVAPGEVQARRSGLLLGRHFPGLVATGDCVAVVGEQL